MFDRDTWQEILATIRKHKLRTALTALGVFWGIFMLIFMLGMGEGLRNAVFRDFGSRAKNVMYVWSSPTSKPYRGFQPGRVPRLNLDDITYLDENVDGIDYIAPRTTISGSISYNENVESYNIRGELSDMITVEGYKVYKGRYIQPSDIEESRKVIVIGKRVAEVLFGKGEWDKAIGKYITANGVEFQVVGIFGPEFLKPWTQEDLEATVIPLTTMHRAFGTGGQIHYFAVSALPQYKVSDIENDVKSILQQRHSVSPQDPRGIGGFNLEKEFDKITGLFNSISVFLWIVGIGTLIAGVIGVSNIMMIVVKERTKEIGIRKALGATPGVIIRSILTESIVITLISGYLGLLAGTLLIGSIDYIMEYNEINVQMFYNPEVSLQVGIGALLILIISGTIAGFIPGMMAAKVNPVLALKDE
ncbi:ABC transporter permease [Membranihabitans maritimus]|uniref:ABC transporter permease n=1 Tax=Membranihabitans maritimus TaxID=2904244 RepID=UPI001F3CD7C7|nr:ABC transporter permease [Membranihabitans maritimus]